MFFYSNQSHEYSYFIALHTQKRSIAFKSENVCVCVCVCTAVLSLVQLFVSSWTVACQAPLSMGFPGKNTGMGCHFLLHRIFLSQRSNPCLFCLLNWQVDSLPLVLKLKMIQ